MAVSYEIPPWLHGANPLQAVTSGAELGLRIAEANNRSAIAWAELQRRNQEVAQSFALHQHQLEQEQAFREQQFMAQQNVQQQNQLREDQKLQIEKSYHDATIGLKQQQLDMAAKAAAEKANASGRFLQSLNTLSSGYIAEEGLSEDQARAKAVPQALFDSGLFQYVSPASIAGMARSVTTKQGEWKTSPSGQPYFETAAGGLHFEPRPIPSPEFAANKLEASDITAKIRSLEKQKDAIAYEVNGVSIQDQKNAIDNQIDNLTYLRRALVVGKQKQTAPPETVMPAPPAATATATAAAPTSTGPALGSPPHDESQNETDQNNLILSPDDFNKWLKERQSKQ